jgi:hypothetical protein
MVFSLAEGGCFTSFSAQTEEAQNCHYDHDDADDVENVHCRRSLFKSSDKSAQSASKFLRQQRDHQRSPIEPYQAC